MVTLLLSYKANTKIIDEVGLDVNVLVLGCLCFFVRFFLSPIYSGVS